MNRRKVLQLLCATASAPLTASTVNLAAISQALAQNIRGKRLILIELAGANDGLNTLVPVNNEHYHQARPTLGLKKQQVVALDEDFSIHQSLQPMMGLWENAQMAWVHGLGYPSPNRSHFKSISLWETGGDGTRDGRQGWLTHDIEHRLQRRISDAHGISMVGDMNLFSSQSGRWLNMTSPEQFLAHRRSVPTNASVVNKSLQRVTQNMRDLEQALHGLSKKLDSAPTAKRLPGGEFGAQLQQVLRLIRGGVDTPVFRVQLSGFDTHAHQSYKHAALLRTLGSAISAFSNELIKDGEWQNTLMMTYSEFGRRASENQSGGTDHGTAAPHFLIGGDVHGGLYGTPTDLSNISNDGDPDFTMDYRALYSSVLNHWFDISNDTFASYADSRLANIFKYT